MVDKKVSTIRPAAQARLLLYRLLSSHLGESLKILIEEPQSTWEKIIAAIEAQILNEFKTSSAKNILTEAFSYIESSTRRDLERQIIRLTGEKLWLGVFPQGLLDNFIKEHTQLIKDVRIEHLNKISSAIQRGIRQGLLQKDIAKEISHTTDLSKRRARLIARNALLQYSGAITRHHQINAGIKKYRWQTSQDERVREYHKSKNGKIYRWEGSGPHPRSEINCRCDAIPMI